MVKCIFVQFEKSKAFRNIPAPLTHHRIFELCICIGNIGFNANLFSHSVGVGSWDTQSKERSVDSPAEEAVENVSSPERVGTRRSSADGLVLSACRRMTRFSQFWLYKFYQISWLENH